MSTLSLDSKTPFEANRNSVAVKPLLRGHFHQAAFFIALGASAMLIEKTETPRELGAIVTYCVCLCAMLGVSALYHRPQWGTTARMWMKRLDHAAIFLSIAGTGTPICMLGLQEPAASKMLLIFWGAAAVGILQSLFWVRAPKAVSAILYVGMGWLAVPYLGELKQALGETGLVLLLAGGVVYTIGAVIYALKKPDLWPRIFGYHELFHVLVVIAAAIHFMAINHILPE
jgi:hemolysin III